MYRIIVWVVVLTSCKGLTSSGPSATQEHNANKWVFDDEPVDVEEPGKGKRSFEWTDDIYARVFYERPLEEIFDKSLAYPIELGFQIVGNDRISSLTAFGLLKDEWENEYLDVEIFPSAENLKHGYENDRTLVDGLVMSNLGDDPPQLTGTQQVYFFVRGKEDFETKHARSAIITIDFSGRKDKAVKKRAAALRGAADKAMAAELRVPPPGELQDDAKLVRSLEAKARKELEVDEVRVVLPEDEWAIERDEASDEVVFRAAAIVVLSRQSDGECRFYQWVLVQDYVRKRFSSPGTFRSSSKSKAIACATAFEE